MRIRVRNAECGGGSSSVFCLRSEGTEVASSWLELVCLEEESAEALTNGQNREATNHRLSSPAVAWQAWQCVLRIGQSLLTLSDCLLSNIHSFELFPIDTTLQKDESVLSYTEHLMPCTEVQSVLLE